MCDNINQCHDNITIGETSDGIRTYCKLCGKINEIRFDTNGRCDNREYSEIFKRDTVQPGSNLYYKIHPELMSIV